MISKHWKTNVNSLISKGQKFPAAQAFYAGDRIYQEGNQPPRSGHK
jgi:hypothetical protein